MTDTSSLNSKKTYQKKGTLYVVATPIGNMSDITSRAVQTLKNVDVIAAEDTRLTGRLLSFHAIENRLISFYEHNEIKRTIELVKRLHNGESIALVSSAGTPTLSDPGYRLVKKASEEGFRIVPIPGVSAAIAALSVSGLPTDAFVFIGFLPHKEGKRHKALAELIPERKTMIFYESPRRISALLEDLINVLGDRHGVLAREMTKRHEELIRGNLTEILDSIKERAEVKGECTLVVKGGVRKQGNPDSVREDIRAYLKRPGIKISDMSKTIAIRHGLSKQWVYAEAVKLKKSMNDTD